MMWELLVQPFADFGFMRRALMGCIAISVGATPAGVFLMLRRMSLTGDAMAHAILPGAAVGFLVAGLSLGAMTIGGLIAGMTVALLAGFVTRVTALREDASLAAFYLISLAVGVLIVSTRGSNVDLMHVLFGTVLALDDDALILLCSIASLSVLTLAVLFRPLVLECADPQFLRSVSGLKGRRPSGPADPRTGHSCRVRRKHNRFATPETYRGGDGRQDRRHALSRRAFRPGRSGADLSRHDAAQRDDHRESAGAMRRPQAITLYGAHEIESRDPGIPGTRGIGRYTAQEFVSRTALFASACELSRGG